MLPTFPSRYAHLAEARLRFGDRVDRLGPYLTQVDPLADRVVEAFARLPRNAGAAFFDQLASRPGHPVPGSPDALREFFASVERVPVWVDWEDLDRGGQILVRAGPLGGLVLGLKSLVLAYTSPAGNKPLVFSGRLEEHAARRLAETARFVRETIVPGGLRPGAAGWRVTLKVRLIHAQVRRMILETGRWNAAAWGAPINQHDEAGTSLLFSVAVLEGLRQLGVHVSADESEAYMRLWRWSGWLMGVDPELLATTESEGARLAQVMAATQDPPDDDSRALTRALLESPAREADRARVPPREPAPGGSSGGARPEPSPAAVRRAVAFSGAICRMLVGDPIADDLAIARTSWRYTVPFVRRLVAGVDLVRQNVPFVRGSTVRAGTRYWDRAVHGSLIDPAAVFQLPQRLSPAA